MKIVIDTDLLLKERCPTKEALLLVALYHNIFNKATIDKAVLDGYLTFNDVKKSMECDKFVLTKKGSEKVESIMVNSEIVENTDKGDRFLILANKMRDIYPNGRKPGTAYQWKDSATIIALRLKSLVKKYGLDISQYTDEDFVNATRKYVQSFNGNYTYMQLLKYFIMKNNMMDRAEDASQLLSYLDNAGQSDVTNVETGELL